MQVRILPMSANDPDFIGKSIEQVQSEFFMNHLKNDNSGYKFITKMNAQSGDLILFQFKSTIIASAIFDKLVIYGSADAEGYFGEYFFKADTIRIFRPIDSEELKKYSSNFNGFNQSKQYLNINNFADFINRINIYDYSSNALMQDNTSDINLKRVNTKEDWVEILQKENHKNNIILDMLFYMMGCKDYTSNCKNIQNALKIDNILNLEVMRFGKRIIELKKIPNQIGSNGDNRYWNIPFETVVSKNKNGIFTWKLRHELVEALSDLYDFNINTDINKLFEEVVENFNPEIHQESIKDYLKIQNQFVNNFTINKIMNMELDEYVIGKARFEESGLESFCYILERKLKPLGSILGATSSKFGIWYSPKEKQYKVTKKYGGDVDTAFEIIKKEICKLIIAGNNDDYEMMNESLLSQMFKGKILSTYFSDKYLPIFDEDDVDIFLNLLNIRYDIHEYNTVEKRKILLKKYKDNNPILSKYSDYYFISVLYLVFKQEMNVKHTVAGEIDYNIQFVDFNYLGKHITDRKENFRSRDTDYEKINRNKKNVGNRGEIAVINFEKQLLQSKGFYDLADMVSQPENDAIGYDVLSFETDGTEKHIEVKTNACDNTRILDFYLTDNEFQKMISDPNYYIYYLFSIKKNPKIHIVNKKLLEQKKELFLQPVLYKISIDVEQNTNKVN